MNCKHWSDCGIVNAGCCAKGLHGGKPHNLVCQQCDAYEGRFRGLGDAVAFVTKWTGIKRLVDWVAKKRKKTCGCSRRRRTLNRLIPFFRKQS